MVALQVGADLFIRVCVTPPNRDLSDPLLPSALERPCHMQPFGSPWIKGLRPDSHGGSQAQVADWGDAAGPRSPPDIPAHGH